MNNLSSLLEKPWLPLTTEIEAATLSIHYARTAMRFLIAIISVVFFLFILTFITRSQFPDFVALSASPWTPLSNSSQLWLNSAALLLASIALQWACFAAQKRNATAVSVALLIAGLFSLLFLAGQLWLWQRLMALGYFVAANPANSYFYLFTGAHAVHLIGGVVALLYVSNNFLRHGLNSRLGVNLQLCANYWHFLFALWLLLFALLTATPDTYRAIALLCGLGSE